jgi:hypothetical protein
MYDPVNVFIRTADSDGTSNGIVATGRIKVHKVVLSGDSSNLVTALLYNSNAIGVAGTELIALASPIAAPFGRNQFADFNPPVPFEIGLSIDITGNGAVCRVYYTR